MRAHLLASYLFVTGVLTVLPGGAWAWNYKNEYSLELFARRVNAGTAPTPWYTLDGPFDPAVHTDPRMLIDAPMKHLVRHLQPLMPEGRRFGGVIVFNRATGDVHYCPTWPVPGENGPGFWPRARAHSFVMEAGERMGILPQDTAYELTMDNPNSKGVGGAFEVYDTPKGRYFVVRTYAGQMNRRSIVINEWEGRGPATLPNTDHVLSGKAIPLEAVQMKLAFEDELARQGIPRDHVILAEGRETPEVVQKAMDAKLGLTRYVRWGTKQIPYTPSIGGLLMGVSLALQLRESEDPWGTLLGFAFGVAAWEAGFAGARNLAYLAACAGWARTATVIARTTRWVGRVGVALMVLGIALEITDWIADTNTPENLAILAYVWMHPEIFAAPPGPPDLYSYYD